MKGAGTQECGSCGFWNFAGVEEYVPIHDLQGLVCSWCGEGVV